MQEIPNACFVDLKKAAARQSLERFRERCWRPRTGR